jgi:hypothetical protein
VRTTIRNVLSVNGIADKNVLRLHVLHNLACSVIDRQYCGGNYRLHLLGRKCISSAALMYHIPEERNVNIHCHEKLEFYRRLCNVMSFLSMNRTL